MLLLSQLCLSNKPHEKWLEIGVDRYSILLWMLWKITYCRDHWTTYLMETAALLVSTSASHVWTAKSFSSLYPGPRLRSNMERNTERSTISYKTNVSLAASGRYQGEKSSPSGNQGLGFIVDERKGMEWVIS
jgi:hypothetical protein